MKVIIFGASGTLGSHLVEQALAEGHEVTAAARRPDRLKLQHPRLKREALDVLDKSAVQEALRGQEAVIIALGAGRKGQIRSQGTKVIIAGMEHHQIQRLICLSSLGCGDSRANLNFFWREIMFGLLLKQAMNDHEIQEGLVRKSQLDWTIVRPGAFSDGPITKVYRENFAPEDKAISLKISRADAAHFMLQQLEDKRYLHHAPSLSYA